MQEFSNICTGLSVAFLVSVFVIYAVQIHYRVSNPHPVTWGIWLIVFILNTITYYFVSERDMMRVLQTGTSAVLISLILVYVVAFKKEFSKIRVVDIVCIPLTIIVGVFWKTSGDKITTNLLLQVIFAISYVPTVYGIIAKGNKESPWSWTMAVISYVFMITAMVTDPETERLAWYMFAFPVVNGILGNGSIAFFAMLQMLRRRRRRKKPV